MVALGVAAGLLLGVVVPRLKGSRRGILFFNAIAEYESSVVYTEDVIRRPDNEIVRTKLQHTYELAKVCRSKYRVLIAGLYVAIIGVTATLLYFVLGARKLRPIANSTVLAKHWLFNQKVNPAEG
jgi:hypothetical protein